MLSHEMLPASAGDIGQMARQLRLTLIAEQAETMLAAAQEAKMTGRELLAFMFSKELERRKMNRSVMGIHSAHFPFERTLESFDFSVIPSIDPGRIRDLKRLDWVRRGANLLLQGPPGVGKTHLAIGFGREAIAQDFKVLFVSAEDLVYELVAASHAGQLRERVAAYAKPAVLIIDELGYLPLGADAAHVLFSLISARYERKSTVITCNRAISEWGMMLGDSTTAMALLDRFLHHSEVLTISGDSYRLLEKKREGLLAGAISAKAEEVRKG